jgi:uncharacterized protein (DUF302 family)
MLKGLPDCGSEMLGCYALIKKEQVMKGLRILLLVLITGLFSQTETWSSDVRSHGQPVVVNSHYSFSQTISKLKGSIEKRNLKTSFEINHNKIVEGTMAMAGIEGKNIVTLGFFGPEMGREILQAEPRAALEIPLKIAIKEFEDGRVDVIYYQPSYLFEHYQNKQLVKLSRKFDILVGNIILEATGTKGAETKH